MDSTEIHWMYMIETFKSLMDATKDKDMVTYNLALTILQQEVEHEEDLQSLKEDLDLMVTRGSQMGGKSGAANASGI